MNASNVPPGEANYSTKYSTRPHKYVWKNGTGAFAACTQVKESGLTACTICGAEFRNPKSVYKHLKSEHADIICEYKNIGAIDVISEVVTTDVVRVDRAAGILGEGVSRLVGPTTDASGEVEIGADDPGPKDVLSDGNIGGIRHK